MVYVNIEVLPAIAVNVGGKVGHVGGLIIGLR